jgi:hypothetical protein
MEKNYSKSGIPSKFLQPGYFDKTYDGGRKYAERIQYNLQDSSFCVVPSTLAYYGNALEYFYYLACFLERNKANVKVINLTYLRTIEISNNESFLLNYDFIFIPSIFTGACNGPLIGMEGKRIEEMLIEVMQERALMTLSCAFLEDWVAPGWWSKDFLCNLKEHNKLVTVREWDNVNWSKISLQSNRR